MRHSSELVLADGTVVEVVRSTRRTRSVSASREAGRTVIQAPARMPAGELRRVAEELHARLLRRQARARPSDAALASRCAELSAAYLDSRAVPTSVRWVATMRSRWASCTPVDGTIRVSDRLLGAPSYVLDYVLVHELAHLLEPGHGPAFWAWVERYPQLERARGFLEGFAAGQRVVGASEPDQWDADLDQPSEPGSDGGSPASSSADRSSGAERSA